MKKINQIDRSTLGVFGLVLVVVLFFAVNIIATFAFKSYRADLTQARLYSLSQGSLDALKNIKEPLTVRFYMSSKLAQVSELHASYAVRVLELLEQYAAEGGGKVRLEVVDPEPFSKNEDEALALGMKGIPVGNSSEYVYMGLVIANSSDRKRIIALLDPTRERFLEYDITKYLTDLTRSKRPTVGIMSTFPIDGQGSPQLMYPKYLPRWAVMQQIRDIFDVRFISRQTLDIPPEIDVLMLVNPKKFTDETLYAIDQFLMRGGTMLVLIDPLSEVEIASGEAPYSVSPDMTRLFDAWGISFNPNVFVGDAGLARSSVKTIDGKTIQTKFPPWIAVDAKHMNPQDPVTGSLTEVNLSYAGHFTVKNQVDGLSVVPLLMSSQDSQVFPIKEGLRADVADLARRLKPSGKNYALGVRIKGTPDSAFDKAPTRNFLAQRTQAHIAKAVKPTNIVLIADSDFLADRYWTDSDDLMGTKQYYPFAGNGDLVVNALDNLSDSASLIDLRSKTEWRRPFVVLEELAQKSDKQYREQENKLFVDLAETQDRLKSLTENASEAGADLLNREDMEQIRTLQERVVELRKSLRAVQSVLNRDMVAMQTSLMILNIVLVPALLLIVALFVAWRRRNRRFSGFRKG